MAYLSVKHNVNNFDHWKTVYDSLQSARSQRGFIGSQILRGAGNPNQVLVLEEYQTLEGQNFGRIRQIFTFRPNMWV
jgi:heme-degrading monooxygenase HmoA